MAMSFYAYFSWSCLQGKKLSLKWFLTVVGCLRIFNPVMTHGKENIFDFFSAPYFPHSINHILCKTLLQKPPFQKVKWSQIILADRDISHLCLTHFKWLGFFQFCSLRGFSKWACFKNYLEIFNSTWVSQNKYYHLTHLMLSIILFFLS